MKLAVLCDLLEEGWFSMDLLGDMLLEQAASMPGVEVARVRPRLPIALARLVTTRRDTWQQRWGNRGALGIGRYLQYPVHALLERGRHDFYHVTDHSYSHLLFELPAARTGVFCHDLDAFRPWLEGKQPHAGRTLARALLSGLQRARVVFHSSLAVREEILRFGLVDEARLVHAPYGVAREFQPEPRPEDALVAGRPPFVLHVGSLIPRKNPEFLLRLCVELCRARPSLEVFQIGGIWTDAQRELLVAAGVAARVHQIPRLARPELSAYFRAAGAVILPSLAEGFGLPVVEALACGAPVIVNDIPVLTQVGGDAVVKSSVTDLVAYREAVLAVLDGHGPPRDRRLSWAARYTWPAHARTIVETYAGLEP